MPQLNGVDAAKAPAVVISFLFRHPELTRQLRLIRTVSLRQSYRGDGRTERWKWQTFKEQKQQLNNAVSIDNVKPGSLQTGKKPQMASIRRPIPPIQRQWTYCEAINAKLEWRFASAGFIIDANPQSAKIATLSAAIMVCSPMRMQQTPSRSMSLWRKQPNQWSYRHVCGIKRIATSFNNQNTAKTDVNGLATFIWKVVSRKTTRLKSPLKMAWTNVNRQFCRRLEYRAGWSAESKNEVVADGNDSVTMTATVGMQKATCSMTSWSLSMLIQQGETEPNRSE